MGALTDRLDRLEIEAWSPDGLIKVTARGNYQVTVHITEGAYARYGDATIARQLAGAAGVTWARYRREYLEMLAVFRDGQTTDHDGPEDRVFRERSERMTVAGTSGRGLVSLSSRALVRWEVVVAEGTVRSLPEREFLAEVDSALAAVLADYRTKVIRLTDEIYDIGLPESFRQAMVAR